MLINDNQYLSVIDEIKKEIEKSAIRILLSQAETISYLWISPSVHLTVTPLPALPDMQKTPAVDVSILPQEFFIQCPFL